MSEKIGFTYSQTIKEARFDKANRTVEVTVIKAGWSKNRVYYPQEVLPQIENFLNTSARKVYMDHSDNGATSTRKMTEWVADVVSAHVDGNCVKATIKVHKSGPNAWLYERMQETNVVFGPSISGVADVTSGEAEGQSGKIVQKITYIGSFDIVSSPAAGGNIRESITFPIPEDIQDHMSDDEALRFLSGRKSTSDNQKRTLELITTGKVKDKDEMDNTHENLFHRKENHWWETDKPEVDNSKKSRDATKRKLGLK